MMTDRPAQEFDARRASSVGFSITPGDSSWLLWMMLPAISLMLVSAWWCTGFIQADEHFQVLEFAGARIGLSPLADLPWEYAARARSWLLPAIAAVARRGMIAIGHDDPFVCAFLLRFASGVLYLAAGWRVAKATPQWFRSRMHWRAAVVLGLGLWFVPVVAGRFSAESVSGSLFFLGFATLVRIQIGERCGTAEIFLGGMALAAAYVTRFQVLLLDAGAIAWLLRAGGLTRRSWALIGGGAAAALATGAVIDAWGYGSPALPVWNYCVAQFSGGVLQRYVALPWWWYARALLYAAGWPVGLALLVGFLGLCARRSVHPLAWTLVPFVVFHLLVPTKELRYLFPLLVAAPYVIVLGLESWWRAAFFARHQIAVRLLGTVLVAANFAVFAVRLWIPMEPRIAVQEIVYRRGAHTVITLGDRDPYLWWGLAANWYRRANLRVVHAADPQAARRMAEASPQAVVIARAPELPDDGDGSCRIVHMSVPLRIADRWRPLFDRFAPERDAEPGWWQVARCDSVLTGR